MQFYGIFFSLVYLPKFQYSLNVDIFNLKLGKDWHPPLPPPIPSGLLHGLLICPFPFVLQFMDDHVEFACYNSQIIFAKLTLTN